MLPTPGQTIVLSIDGARVEGQVHADSATLDPMDRVRIANELMAKHAMDAPMRRLAGRIIGESRNVYRDAPRRIGRWIKRNIKYQQEAPGVEILQGPYTTLWTGYGDCDDLSILFGVLMRAAGVGSVYLVGVGEPHEPGIFYHAVNYDADSGLHYDLTDDSAYGGRPNHRLVWTPDPRCVTVFYAPEPGIEGFFGSDVPTEAPYEPYTKDEVMAGALYQKHYSRMNGSVVIRPFQEDTYTQYGGRPMAGYPNMYGQHEMYGRRMHGRHQPNVGRRPNFGRAGRIGNPDKGATVTAGPGGGGGGGGGRGGANIPWETLIETGGGVASAALARPESTTVVYEAADQPPGFSMRSAAPWMIGGAVVIIGVVAVMALQKK